MKWVLKDAQGRTILRRVLDGFTVELLTPAGRNTRGPVKIPSAVALHWLRDRHANFVRME